MNFSSDRLPSQPPYFTGGGAMGELMRSFDWPSTRIGDPASWPGSLLTTVNLCLNSPFPATVSWGNEMVQFYNDAFHELIGGQEQLTPWLESREIFPPECWQMLEDVLLTGKAGYLVDQQLQQRYFTCSFTPVFSTDGRPEGVYCTLMEVSAQAELALREAKEESDKQKKLLEAVSSSTPDLVYIFDPQYHFTYVNRALLNMWGRTYEDSVGKRLLEVGYEDWHAEMHEREIDEVIATGKSIRGEVSFPHAELGRRIYDYIFAPVKDEDGNVVLIAGTTRDISDLKKAEETLKQTEEQFRTLTQSVPQLIWTANADGYCDYFNQQWYDFTGSTPEQSCGDGWAQYIHEHHRSALYATWKESLATGMPVAFEFQLRNKSGGYQWFYVSGNPIRDENGAIIKWVGALNNIDVHKASQDKLENMVMERTRELQRSNDDLQQFAHVASHDLKEPLRKVKYFAGRLQDDKDSNISNNGLSYLTKILAASERMSTMIEGVLKYSSTAATTTSFELVDLNKIIQEIEAELEVVIQQTGASIQVQQLPIVEGATVLLHQLFYNLVINSLKFSRKEVPPVIRISAGFTDLRGGIAVRVSFSDNGIGFDPQFSESIFQTFTRLNSKDNYEGTGLGLALCKKIVERHHGTIEATGEVDKGATFLITLPLTQTA